MITVSLTRRAFAGCCATTAIAIGAGAGVRALGSDPTLLRPPGAQDADQLFGACLRCDRCRSICPTGIVVPSTMFDGVISARTPKLDFHRGECTFCDECLRVCPTGAIQAFDSATDKIGVAVVQPDRCLAYDTGCRVCVDACAYEAITVDENGFPQVNAETCNGCGACEYVCPALVYRSFPGGKRRGIVVVSPEEFDQLGTTTAVVERG